jgi:hypothetical protein
MPRTRKRLLSTLVPFALLMLALPALAGGPFEPPDGVGNPSGRDYTGYRVVGYFIGTRRSADQFTQISCMNQGGVAATEVAVQYYNTTSNPSRSPSADITLFGIPVSDIQFANNKFADGTAPDFAIARILAIDGSRKKNPNLVCKAWIQNDSDSTTAAELSFVAPPKKRKR